MVYKRRSNSSVDYRRLLYDPVRLQFETESSVDVSVSVARSGHNLVRFDDVVFRQGRQN